MTAAELRARLEDAGATLSVVDRQLHVVAPAGVLTDELRGDIRRLRGALTAHVAAWPCTGCGRSPWASSTRCARCAKGIRR